MKLIFNFCVNINKKIKNVKDVLEITKFTNQFILYHFSSGASKVIIVETAQ